MVYDPNTAKCAPDWAQYAPQAGTWVEVASNLRGVATDALETGRKLRDDADKVIVAYGKVLTDVQGMADGVKAGATAGRDLAQKMVDTWGTR